MKIEKKPSIGNFVRNIPLLVSCLAYEVLLVAPSTIPRYTVLLAALVVFSFFLRGVHQYWKENLSWMVSIISICLFGMLAGTFAIRYKFGIFAQYGIDMCIILVPCTVVGLYSFSLLIEIVYSFLTHNTPERYNMQEQVSAASLTKAQLVLIVLSAFATITICSKSSPLYPLNDWMDANCFLTVGKSMLHGKVPYLDLYEQKGPLLYMLHALAAMVSERSFIGVYILEIIACVIFLLYGFKIMRLYVKSVDLLCIPVLAAIIYSSLSFRFGDSAEEFCLPLIAYTLYVGLKQIKTGQAPTNKECVMVGITSACVLWIKYTMLGFYLGWICVPAFMLLKEGKGKRLLQMLAMIVIGIIILTMPIMIYFAANEALPDLWTAYFYNNIFLYSSFTQDIMLMSLAYNTLSGIDNMLSYNLLSLFMIIIGMLILVSNKIKYELCFFLSTLIGIFLLVYMGGRHFIYYSLIFSVFAPIGLIVLIGSVQVLFKEHHWLLNKYWKCLVYAICIVFMFVRCRNTYLLQYNKSDLPQYQFAEIIAKVENATLLNYGFLDGGFYTTTGIIPNCKYFCKLNISLDEMQKVQDEFVSQGKVDFIVTRNLEINDSQYECIATIPFFYEGAVHKYTLYRLIQEGK